MNKGQSLQKYEALSYGSCALHFSTRSICLWNFKSVAWILRVQDKNENEQRAITPKVWSLELWFMCTALLNEIHLPMKFQVSSLNTSSSGQEWKWTKGNNSESMKLWSYAPDKKRDRRMSQLLYATLRGHKQLFRVRLLTWQNDNKKIILISWQSDLKILCMINWSQEQKERKEVFVEQCIKARWSAFHQEVPTNLT